ncbi:MAG: NAD(P)-dependent oxidoreductase [Oscillibacter sp.]|jgi:UDP-glucose 4-epimerase|nr:NAD(P)-dependent oxidoreductase [Oscillibacter sp.]
MKRILLTGAGPRGFVGRNLAPALRKRYEVFTPSSRELNLCDYDLVARYLDEHRIDAVIHGALQSVLHTGPEDVMLHDLQMFYNLDRLSGQLDKLLYFGSGAEFDKRFPMEDIREEDIGRSIPTWYYGLEKYIMTLHARKSRNIYNLRLFGIFGKYEHWQSKFISNLCCKAMYDLPLSIRQDCMFDYLYVDDLAPIVIWFLEHEPKFHDYNVCTGRPVSLREIADVVLEVSGKALPVEVAKEGWNLAYTASCGRLEAEMGPLELHSFKDAVTELYAYYQAHKAEIPYGELKKTR